MPVFNFFLFSLLDHPSDRFTNHDLFRRESCPWNYGFILFFSVTFPDVFPGAYHLTRGETRRRLGVLPMLPIAPFST